MIITASEVKTSESKPKSFREPLVEDWISDSEDENETEFKSKQRKPSFAKVEFVKSNKHVKSPREFVKKVGNNKQVKYPRKNSQSPRDCDFYEKKMVGKPVWNNVRRVNHQNSKRISHPHPKGNFVPKAVLMKSSLKTLNTARQNFSKVAVSVNTARPINIAFSRPTVNCARPASYVFNKAHSQVRRPFNKYTTYKNSNFNEKVNIVKGNVTTAGPKAVGNLQQELEDKRELKFNLFSVSQMCDKKNSVLFTDTECVVLSPYFKLTDESHILLKVPRKDNMYSIDLKNVVPQGGSLVSLQKLQQMNLIFGIGGLDIKPALSFMRPFGCTVTILNTIDHRGKFDKKADEGFFVGYSTNSKAFRVFNSRTRIVEENLHVKFNADTPNITRSRPKWLFDIDALTKSMNYEPVVVGNQSNGNAGTKACNDAGKARVETVPGKDYILLPFLTKDPQLSSSLEDSSDAGFKTSEEEEKKDAGHPENEDNEIVYSDDDEGIGAEADMTSLDNNFPVSPILTTRIQKDHPIEQIIGDIHSAPQTRQMKKSLTNH
ncbi:ribonuclease H-like domain-containing protein, partial [Tanacetum coccineum]